MNSFIKLAIINVFFLSFFLFGGVETFHANESKRNVVYKIEPFFGESSVKLRVNLTFRGNKSGETEIKLPNRFASQTQLYNQIRELKFTDNYINLENTKRPFIKNIKHKPNALINLSYFVEQKDNTVTKAGRGGGYSPIFQKEYLHFIGEGVWIVPTANDESNLKIKLEWQNIPQNWKLANSFGVEEKNQEFTTSSSRFTSAIFVAGDYRVLKGEIKGKPVYTALRGNWKFTDEEFSGLVNKIVEVQRDFWRDYEHPFYLVTLLPLEYERGRRSYGGTGLTNSFATFVTNNVPDQDLYWLIAHEYFHNWNYLSFGGLKEPQELLYWFSEGFTDYYTALLLYRGGFFNFEQFVAKHNELMTDYYLSPYRNINNEQIRKEFFTNIKVTNQAYRRGFLLATKWNRIIQNQTKGKNSIDDVMRDILQGARTGKHKRLSKEKIVSYLSKYAKYDFDKDIEKYVDRGETIVGFENALGKCVDVEFVKKGTFELGWDFPATQKNDFKVVGIKENSVAYEKGVRNGQQIAGLKLDSGKADQPVKMTVIKDGKPTEISYLPMSLNKRNVPKYTIKSNITNLEKLECQKIWDAK